MKKFRYRLEKVLDFREGEKKERERELAQKNSELRDAEQRLDQIIKAQDSATLPIAVELSMSEVMLQRDFQQGLRVLLEEQRQLIQEAAKAVEDARNAYLERAVAAETLVSHKERRFQEFREERRRSERRASDNLTLIRTKRSS
jgi:flagellar FliJ protein